MWRRLPVSYVSSNGKNGTNGSSAAEHFPQTSRRPFLRAKSGHNVSQMHYAKEGIITPEMEYIAIRENIGREKALENGPMEGPGLTREIVSERRSQSS